MASHISFVISGLLLVIITIVVQSFPIEKTKTIVSTNHKPASLKNLLNSADSSKTSTTTSPTTTVSQSSLSTSAITEENMNNKKKRYINDDQLDEILDKDDDDVDTYQIPYFNFENNNDHTLHTKIHETSAKIHDNADKPVDIDDSKVFSDIKMTPNELTDIVRRRREVKFNDESSRRRKRALSPYDFYDSDSLYDPYVDLTEGQQYVRPSRSFAPIYWYPSVYERNIRSVLPPSFYQSSDYPIGNNDEVIENNIYDNDNENDNDYEPNRYPILLPSSNNLFDNLQLQQQYNTDDLPIDEDIEQILNDDNNDDDDDEEQQYRLFHQQRPYNIHYGPIETYF